MIQAVADEGERLALGMHDTSVPNILKVLNPLFLNGLRAQLEEAGDNPRNRIAKLTDITFFRAHEGFLYLAVVIDLFSRRVISWSMQGRNYTDLPLQALLMAVWRRKPKTKVHVHSPYRGLKTNRCRAPDQGSQFTSFEWQEFLE